MYSSEEILAMVNQGLADLRLERQPFGLYKPIRYVLSIGGKRLRPVLLLMSYNMYSDDLQKALPTAVAIETYHNYTLLHDDVMDRAEVRRGKPCVHKVWNENTAILSGDSMLVMAYELIAQCQADCLSQVLDLFTTTALEIGEGQQYDVDFENRMDVSVEEYIEMIRLKTSVLLACAMKMGAMQAGAPEGDCELLYRIGEKVGLAFQLQDDMLESIYENITLLCSGNGRRGYRLDYIPTETCADACHRLWDMIPLSDLETSYLKGILQQPKANHCSYNSLQYFGLYLQKMHSLCFHPNHR